MKNEDLEIAAAQGDVETVKQLLTEENMNQVDDTGYSLVHWAAQEGYIEILNLLAEKGADLNPSENSGITPLMNAAGEGDLEVVTTLVRLGADVNHNTRQGSALHTTAAYNQSGIVRFLIESGADVNAVDRYGRTPRFYAVMHGCLDLAHNLVENGAVEDWQDNDGKLATEVRDD